MAKDLRFYVERYADTNGDVFYIFPFKFENVDSETWSRLKNCASELGTRFSDTQLDKSTHDPDGNPWLFVTARQFLEFEWDSENFDDFDRGMLAFLREVPESTRVILWWTF